MPKIGDDSEKIGLNVTALFAALFMTLVAYLLNRAEQVHPMPKIDERIEALEAKLKQLKVQHQRKEARARTVAGRRARHDELRKKILVGAIVLAKVEDGSFDRKILNGWLDAALTRSDDRALFGIGRKVLMRRFRRVLGLMPVLVLVAGGAQAVDCASNALNDGTVTVCRVDLLHEQLQLFWRDDTGQPYRRFSALRDALAKQGKTLEFSVNGGMYRPDYSPVGLFVADGRELNPLNRHTGPGNFSQQPNGVFLVDGHGARVLSTDEYAEEKPHPYLATQSGPMLVHHGELTTSPVMNPNSQSRRIRNGVCSPSPGTAAFVLSDSPVTFHEFAVYFRESLACREALYLDGSISSLYAPQLARADHWFDMGPIIGVVH